MFPAKIWREFPQRYRWQACQCSKCKKISFPPRQVCPGCNGHKMKPVTLPRHGRLVYFTIIHNAPPAFMGQTPYAVGIVELDNGVQLTCQIVDVELNQLAAGMRVVLEFRMIQKDGDSGVIAYGYKAVPSAEHNTIQEN